MTPDDRLDTQLELGRVKWKFYTVALPFAVAASLLVWITERGSGTLNKFDRVAFPSLAAWLTTMFLLRLVGNQRHRGERFMQTLEYLVLASAMLFFLGRQYFLFYPGYVAGKAGETLLSAAHWEAIVYLLTFLVLPRSAALWTALLFLAVSVALGLGHVVPEALRGEDLSELNYIGQSALSGAASIVLVYILSLVKERYAFIFAHAETMSLMAMTDFLTGIPNRRQMADLVAREIAVAQRHGRAFAVIMFDLDQFKAINDRFGHDTGDRVLRRVVEVVRGKLRTTEWLGRWGGDEFLIVATETTLRQATKAADRLREAIARAEVERVGHVSATFGVAVYRPSDTAETLVKRTDDDLLRHKTFERNRAALERVT